MKPGARLRGLAWGLLLCTASATGCLNLPDPSDHPGFKVRDLRAGKGEPVGAFDTAVVKYVGRFTDGTVFEQTPKPKEYSLLSRTLVPGFKMGLRGMRRGGKRVVTIPPELAFGEKGKLGKIPPNATLIFELELVAIR